MNESVHYERMTATDASFLRIETAHEPQHVGSLSILEGRPLRDTSGAIRFDDLCDHVERRLHRVPRLRQRVMEVPYSQGRPVWVDDDRFDLTHHVRLTALPRPGDEGQLATLMGRLQSLALDRRRPLWEMWFVDGLADDDVALIIKTHHSLGDGIANVDLALALIDLRPDPPPADDPIPWQPRRPPSAQRLLADAVTERIAKPAQMARAATSAIRDSRPAVTATTNTLRTVVEFLSKPDPAPWNQPVSPHRRWVHADVSFALAQQIKEQHGVTVNDVVLAACSGALRDFLLDREVSLDGRSLKAAVPVSIRTDDERGDTLGNRVSLIVVELPVQQADPLDRLHLIHAATSELKGSGCVDGTQTIVRLADSIPPLATQLTRFVSRQIPMNLIITNIPGPPAPLYLLGALVRRTYPYVEVIDHEGLTIAVVSYEGRLCFGITSDRDVVPDLGDVAAGIERHIGLLAEAD